MRACDTQRHGVSACSEHFVRGFVDTTAQVASLSGQAVTRVACGVWHTAAIVSSRPADPGGLAQLPFLERQTVQQKLAAVYELTEQAYIPFPLNCDSGSNYCQKLSQCAPWP